MRNFWWKNLSQILRFVAICKSFLREIWGCGIFWQHQWATLNSISTFIFNQFAKVFSHESSCYMVIHRGKRKTSSLLESNPGHLASCQCSAMTTRQSPVIIILCMYWTGGSQCLCCTPGSHSICVIRTPLWVWVSWLKNFHRNCLMADRCVTEAFSTV